ncbi:Maf family protein [Solemya velesiana gill symbiont]|uniref:7-methyl-GTP pyrophosphatase n=1 Tax=Solemya velesiana gill symbiont TaxID=1918948 RepID=A0A1T2KSK0_9GAMM|nr:nucleoside triphosphate pyrophosphatase [Solemya velesiana gill symbiont]OOZ35849.1 septum formation protein Maf [Solemya velesiana gill symbiont]
MTDRVPQLVLGSTSPFRKALLEKLGLAFSIASPDIDETSSAGETPQDLVTRLAEEKARAVAADHPDSLVIGSDQVACNEGHIQGKPGDRDNAIRQLEAASGKIVIFYTGLCLLNTGTGNSQVVCEPFHVHFRALTRDQIERYLDAEEPYNCPGSFKSEALGISLFKRLEGDDPNALIGLPLIRLIEFLGNEGVQVP